MSKIKILIADNSYLIRQGFISIVEENKDFALVGEAERAEDLNEKLMLCKPDLLIIDFTSAFFCMDDISVITREFPKIKILAITNPQLRSVFSKAIENGVMSYLLKDCGKEEIVEAIYNTAKGQKFFCGKIVDKMAGEKGAVFMPEGVSCDGVRLSPREIEIVQMVAEGLTNKEIADKLFLSAHTVTTHRKNIMGKLGVNNTAGLMMFAIKNEIISPNPFLFEQRN